MQPSLLLETGQAIVAYGVVVLLAAWLAGPTSWAASIRRASLRTSASRRS